MKYDYAIKVIKKHENKLIYKDISYKEINRNRLKIIHKWKKIVLSSTLLRKTIAGSEKELSKLIMWEQLYKYYLK